MTGSCEYCQITGGYGELMDETAHWLIYLAPSQRYLGTCVVALKRKSKNLRELDDAEWLDFADIVRRLETSVDEAFKPTLFNWSCFKNKEYRNGDPNPEIHWHLLPRYQDEVEFAGEKFKDQDFGYLPQPITHELSAEMMDKIKSAIKKYL
ncbi:MAG: HIT family protein [Methanobacterium sp.]|jgi:diadenosine tetraphosphate (Ap4A) HIT family hydrolase|nr:HIT family protein [Methanobacterium sp.]